MGKVPRSFGKREPIKLGGFRIANSPHMVVIAQLVRASDCGSEGRRFEPD